MYSRLIKINFWRDQSRTYLYIHFKLLNFEVYDKNVFEEWTNWSYEKWLPVEILLFRAAKTTAEKKYI